MRLVNKMDEYERNHPDEWCPISDQILKDMFPEECSSQEARDRKAETMSDQEFEIVFDATMQQYRKARKKKQGGELSELSAEREEEGEKVIVEQT
jgi:hypothetical protein